MLTKIIDGKLIGKAEEVMEECRSFVLVCHENPDGDAMGSLLAMSGFLKAMGKTNVVPVSPNRVPDNLKWLPGMEQVKVFTEEKDLCAQLIAVAEVIIFLDFNEVSRTGEALAGCLHRSMATKILLDHHPNPSGDANISISYPEFCATAEVVFRYICRTGNFDMMTREIAECVYTGMMTDTGNFSFNSNRQDIYFIIGELMGKGINKDAIYRRIYAENTVGRTRMQGYLMDRGLEIIPEYGAAVMTLSKAQMRRFGCDATETDGLVNLPLSIRDVILSAFFREDNGIVRVSLRSTGDIPVNRLSAELFNGGGHRNASGGRYQGTIAEGVNRLKEALPGFFAALTPRDAVDESDVEV